MASSANRAATSATRSAPRAAIASSASRGGARTPYFIRPPRSSYSAGPSLRMIRASGRPEAPGCARSRLAHGASCALDLLELARVELDRLVGHVVVGSTE